MSQRNHHRRSLVRFSTLALALSLALMPSAEARLGDRGSMGSRGSNTFSAPPAF